MSKKGINTKRKKNITHKKAGSERSSKVFEKRETLRNECVVLVARLSISAINEDGLLFSAIINLVRAWIYEFDHTRMKGR